MIAKRLEFVNVASMAMAMQMRMRMLALGVGLVVVAAEPVLADWQGGEPSVRTQLDTTEMTLGGRLHLTITVEHHAGTVVAWPDSLDLAPFEILGAAVLEPQRLNGRMRSAARLTLTAFELGELEIPSFELVLAGPDTASAAVLSTDAWTVTVVSVGRDESGDIRDIKGPLTIPRNWLLLLPWALGLAALTAAALWAFRRYRSRREPEARRAPAVPPRAPHEVAYEALDRLERSGLLAKGEIKFYYIEVSDIIRAYVEGRYGVEAMEMATHEVMAGLAAAGLEFETRLEFEHFFGECDLVKFAKLTPEMSSCRAIVPAARRLVDATRAEPIMAPEPEAVEAEPVSSQAEALER